MNNPLVSVLMTVFNHEKFVYKSIKSITNQSYKNLELIVIDNRSNDNSKKIIQKIKDIRIKKKFLSKNIGRTNCLNYGLNLCRGKYIAILDSDDLAKKNRIKNQVEELERNEEIYLLASDYDLIKDNKKITINRNSLIFKRYPRKILFENLICHSSVMYRKKLINLIGKYPTKFKYAQDYAFFLKIFKKFKIKILDQRLISFRITHKNSETFRQYKNKRITKEAIELLFWSLRNYKFKMVEYFVFILNLLKQSIKLIL